MVSNKEYNFETHNYPFNMEINNEITHITQLFSNPDNIKKAAGIGFAGGALLGGAVSILGAPLLPAIGAFGLLFGISAAAAEASDVPGEYVAQQTAGKRITDWAKDQLNGLMDRGYSLKDAQEIVLDELVVARRYMEDKIEDKAMLDNHPDALERAKASTYNLKTAKNIPNDVPNIGLAL